MFGNLPPEILHRIIQNHVSDDLKSLKRCSLVCWEWRHITLPLLLSKITLSLWNGRPFGGKLTLETARTAAPLLARWSRHIVIDFLYVDEDEENLENHILEIISRLRRLTHLSIHHDHYPDWSRLPEETDSLPHLLLQALVAERNVLSKITHLALHGIGWPIQLETLAPALPNLIYLDVQSIKVGYTTSDAQEPNDHDLSTTAEKTRPARIRELAILLTDEYLPAFAQWVVSCREIDFTEIEVLKISTFETEPEMRCLVDHLLAHIGHRVETLCLKLKHFDQVTAWQRQFAEHLPNVTTLRVSIELDEDSAGPEERFLHWLLPLLASFASDNNLRRGLQTVEISVQDIDLQAVIQADNLEPDLARELDELWATVDQKLSPTVTSFVLYSESYSYLPGADCKVEDMRRELPLLASKGALRTPGDGSGLVVVGR